jgi:transcriptional regulator with XRE-family HTH domain
MAKLNENQYAAIALLALPKKGGLTNEEIAEKVGVDRSTLFRWKNNDKFNEELKATIMRNTLERMPEIMESIPDHIINDGNAALFRTLLQAHGMLTEKHEVTNSNDGNADIADMKRKLAEYRSANKPE